MLLLQRRPRHQMPEVQTRCIRDGVRGLVGDGGGGVHGRGPYPQIPCPPMIFATVLRDTASPAARRSARIRGAPLTPSDEPWKCMTKAVSPARRAARDPGGAACRAAQA